MLDADSVFERLLREAANLVPKMSTPRLTNALKVTSTLQQRITETLASRLQTDKTGIQFGPIDINPQYSINSQRVFSDTCIISVCESSSEMTDNICMKQNNKNLDISSSLPQKETGNEDKTNAPSACSSDHSSITFLTDSPLSSRHPLTVVSRCPELISSGAILLPVLPGNHTTSIYRTATTVPTSSHPSVVSGSESGCLTIRSSSPAFRTETPMDKNASDSTTDCNGRDSSLDADLVDSDLQPAVSDNSVDLKPEPVDCGSQASVTPIEPADAASTINSLSEFSAVTYSHLPTLGQFTSMSSVTPPNTTSIAASRTSSSVISIEGFSPSSSEVAPSGTKASAGTGPYRCRDCDKEFRILRYLEKHRRIHTGEKPYQCCYCGRQFNDWPNMNRHKRIHTGERPYRCSVCAKTFSQPAVYNEHVKRHTGERPYICMVCAKGFPRAARLAVHMRVHTGERPYPCTSCERRFSQPHHLAAHLRVHSGDRPYSCPKCDVSFACISNLRRHRKQVHPTSPGPVDENSDHPDSIVSLDEKKPSLLRLQHMHTTNEPNNSNQPTSICPSLTRTSANICTDPPVALAAGTLLTATGALVPAGLLPASSLPGLILTSGPPGTLLAAPAQFADQQSHLQPALIAHTSGLVGGTGTELLSPSVVTSQCSIGHHPSMTSDSLLKSVSSSTLSLMLPTVLTATSGAEALRQTAVTFLTPSGDLDRSVASLAGATLTATSHEGGLLLHSAGNEAVYLEPLDPRMTFEAGHQFTLTTIPTTHSAGTATILGPSTSGTHLFGHPFQLQAGSHGTHIAFTNLPNHSSHVLAAGSSLFSNTVPSQNALFSGHNTSSLIFPSPAAVSHTPATTTVSRQQAVLQPLPTPCSAPSQLLHYHRPTSAPQAASSPGRPSSTPTQQPGGMLVPVLSTRVNITSSCPSANPEPTCTSILTNQNWPANFVSMSASQVSPDNVSHEELTESNTFGNSRPSSVLSSSSLGAITVTAVTETNL